MRKVIIFWILVLLIMTSFASASTVVTQTMTPDSLDSTTTAYGGKFRTNSTLITLEQAGRFSTSNPTRARLYKDDDTLIETSTTLVGDNFTFSSNLEINTVYYILMDASGGSYTYQRSNGAIPFTTENITWIDGVYGEPHPALHGGYMTNLRTLTYSPIPPSIPDTINISATNPLNNTQFNHNDLNFNATVNASQPFNCTFYLNNTVNQTLVYTTTGNDIFVNFNATIPYGDWTYNITCNTNDTTASGTNNLFFIDTTEPSVSVNFSDGFYKWNTTFSHKFMFEDESSLWGYNITQFGALINYTANLQTKYYNYTITNSTTYMPLGQMNYSVWVADGHTLAVINDFDVSKTGNKLNVDRTSVESLEAVDKITYVKNTDRYNFCFYYDTPQTSVQFRMPSDCYYQSKSRYLGHFVCPNDSPPKWIDLENEDGFGISVDTKTNTVTVLADRPTQKFCFNSIGALNTIERNYSFYIWNETTYGDLTKIEGQSATFRLQLESSNESYTSSVSFYYNNTYYTPTWVNGSGYRNYTTTLTTPTVSSDTNIVWWFNYTFNGALYNTTATNQTIYNVALDNCSTYGMRGLNFTFYNTSVGVDLNVSATMEGHLVTDNYGTFNLEWGSSNNMGVCIYPNSTSTVSATQFEYTIPGCGTRNYYLDTTIDNSTSQIKLYCDSETDQVTFTVYNQYKVVLPDVYIYIQKYDVGTGTSTTVEIIKTDSNGQAVGNIIKNTQLYKFVLVYEGAIALETSETYILLDSYSFTLPGGSSYFDDYDHIFGDTSCSLTYTNATTSFSYSFLDSSNNVTQGCLEIYRVSNKGTVLVNSSCLTGASGGIELIIPSPLGDYTYEGIGVVYIDDEKFVCSDSVDVSFDYGYKDYGDETLFLSFLLIIFLICVGLWNPAVAVALMIGCIFLLNIIGWFHMSKVWIIGFVILGGIVIYKMRQT